MNQLKKCNDIIRILGVVVLLVGLFQMFPHEDFPRFHFNKGINIFTISGMLLLIFGLDFCQESGHLNNKIP